MSSYASPLTGESQSASWCLLCFADQRSALLYSEVVGQWNATCVIAIEDDEPHPRKGGPRDL